MFKISKKRSTEDKKTGGVRCPYIEKDSHWQDDSAYNNYLKIADPNIKRVSSKPSTLKTNSNL